MGYEFDWKKSAKNKADPARGFGFELIFEFNWGTAIDLGMSYEFEEERIKTVGYVRERLHIVVWTPRDGKKRVISMRKANARERRQYEKGRAKSA